MAVSSWWTMRPAQALSSAILDYVIGTPSNIAQYYRYNSSTSGMRVIGYSYDFNTMSDGSRAYISSYAEPITPSNSWILSPHGLYIGGGVSACRLKRFALGGGDADGYCDLLPFASGLGGVLRSDWTISFCWDADNLTAYYAIKRVGDPGYAINDTELGKVLYPAGTRTLVYDDGYTGSDVNHWYPYAVSTGQSKMFAHILGPTVAYVYTMNKSGGLVSSITGDDYGLGPRGMLYKKNAGTIEKMDAGGAEWTYSITNDGNRILVDDNYSPPRIIVIGPTYIKFYEGSTLKNTLPALTDTRIYVGDFSSPTVSYFDSNKVHYGTFLTYSGMINGWVEFDPLRKDIG